MRTPDKLPKVRCSCRPKATLPPDHASEEEAYYQQYSKHVASYHRAQRQRIAFSKRSGLLLLGCVLVVAVALMAGPAHAGKDRGRKDAGPWPQHMLQRMKDALHGNKGGHGRKLHSGGGLFGAYQFCNFPGVSCTVNVRAGAPAPNASAPAGAGTGTGTGTGAGAGAGAGREAGGAAAVGPTPVTVVVVNNNNNNNNNNNLLSGSRGGNASGVYNGTRRAGDMTRGSMQRGPLGSGVANGTTQSFTADPRDTSSVSWQELRVMRMPAAGAAGSAAARADAAANATVGARPAISAPGLTIAFAPAAAEAGPAPSPAAAEPAVPPPARAPVLGGGGLITSRLPEARAAAAPAGASAADAAASRPIAGTLAAGAQGSPEARVLSQQGPADRTSQPGSGLGSSIGLRDGIPAASFQLGSGASQVLGRINSQLQRPAPDFGLLGLGRGAGAAYAGSDDSGTGLDSGEGAVGGKDGGELVAPAAAESAAAALARPVRVQVMRPKTNTPEQDTTMYVIRMEGKEGA